MYELDDNVIGEEIFRQRFSYSNDNVSGYCYVTNFNNCHDKDNNYFYFLLSNKNTENGIVTEDKPYRLTIEYIDYTECYPISSTKSGINYYYYIKTFHSSDEAIEEIKKITSFNWLFQFKDYLEENYVLYARSNKQVKECINGYIFIR